MYRPYTSPQQGTGSSSDVETTIRGLTQDFRTAFNTGNYDQVATLFAADGVFMAPNHEPVTGQKAIERKLAEFGDEGYQDLRVETLRVDYSGDMAMEVGRYTVSIVKEDGHSVIDHGKYLVVWRRLGAWRVVADCWSSNLPVAVLEGKNDKGLPLAEKLTIVGDDAEKIA
jgi:uncharacterized protein (TIGR02246 family)